MPLPGLDSTGRGPHTETAQSGRLSRQRKINHLPFLFLFSFSFLFTIQPPPHSLGKNITVVSLKTKQLSSSTASAPKHKQASLLGCSTYRRAGRHRQAWQVGRKISVTPARIVRFTAVIKTLIYMFRILSVFSFSHKPCASSLIIPALSLYMYTLLPAARRREGMESG